MRRWAAPPCPRTEVRSGASLYFTHSRDEEDKFLTMFDNADILQCYRRTESIVPQQALALANAAVSLDAAGKIAQRIHASHPSADRGAFVDGAFGLCSDEARTRRNATPASNSGTASQGSIR